MTDDFNIHINSGKVSSVSGSDSTHFHTEENDNVFVSDKDFLNAELINYDEITIQPNFITMEFRQGKKYNFQYFTSVNEGFWFIEGNDLRISVYNDVIESVTGLNDNHITSMTDGFYVNETFTGSLAYYLPFNANFSKETIDWPDVSGIKVYLSWDNIKNDSFYRFAFNGDEYVDVQNKVIVNTHLNSGHTVEMHNDGNVYPNYIVLSEDLVTNSVTVTNWFDLEFGFKTINIVNGQNYRLINFPDYTTGDENTSWRCTGSSGYIEGNSTVLTELTGIFVYGDEDFLFKVNVSTVLTLDTIWLSSNYIGQTFKVIANVDYKLILNFVANKFYRFSVTSTDYVDLYNYDLGVITDHISYNDSDVVIVSDISSDTASFNYLNPPITFIYNQASDFTLNPNTYYMLKTRSAYDTDLEIVDQNNTTTYLTATDMKTSKVNQLVTSTWDDFVFFDMPNYNCFLVRESKDHLYQCWNFRENTTTGESSVYIGNYYFFNKTQTQSTIRRYASPTWDTIVFIYNGNVICSSINYDDVLSRDGNTNGVRPIVNVSFPNNVNSDIVTHDIISGTFASWQYEIHQLRNNSAAGVCYVQGDIHFAKGTTSIDETKWVYTSEPIGVKTVFGEHYLKNGKKIGTCTPDNNYFVHSSNMSFGFSIPLALTTGLSSFAAVTFYDTQKSGSNIGTGSYKISSTSTGYEGGILIVDGYCIPGENIYQVSNNLPRTGINEAQTNLIYVSGSVPIVFNSLSTVNVDMPFIAASASADVMDTLNIYNLSGLSGSPIDLTVPTTAGTIVFTLDSSGNITSVDDPTGNVVLIDDTRFWFRNSLTLSEPIVLRTRFFEAGTFYPNVKYYSPSGLTYRFLYKSSTSGDNISVLNSQVVGIANYTLYSYDNSDHSFMINGSDPIDLVNQGGQYITLSPPPADRFIYTAARYVKDGMTGIGYWYIQSREGGDSGYVVFNNTSVVSNTMVNSQGDPLVAVWNYMFVATRQFNAYLKTGDPR